MSFDPSKYSKPSLNVMLKDEAFKPYHEVIKAFLTPKPKDLTPVEGKVQWKSKASTVSTTTYPKGYVRLELNAGAGCLYKNGVVELIAHLQELVANGAVKDRA
jgi:hypothetical protein